MTDAFAAHADPDGKNRLVMVVDDAGWHRAKRFTLPANFRLHVLPPCTPMVQPVEPFWALVREATANETYDRSADLRRATSGGGSAGWPRNARPSYRRVARA